jgi:hypothetical protein
VRTDRYEHLRVRLWPCNVEAFEVFLLVIASRSYTPERGWHLDAEALHLARSLGYRVDKFTVQRVLAGIEEVQRYMRQRTESRRTAGSG